MKRALITEIGQSFFLMALMGVVMTAYLGLALLATRVLA